MYDKILNSLGWKGDMQKQNPNIFELLEVGLFVDRAIRGGVWGKYVDDDLGIIFM